MFCRSQTNTNQISLFRFKKSLKEANFKFFYVFFKSLCLFLTVVIPKTIGTKKDIYLVVAIEFLRQSFVEGFLIDLLGFVATQTTRLADQVPLVVDGKTQTTRNDTGDQNLQT